MGSFKSQAALAQDGQAVLTVADRPLAKYEEVEGKQVLVRAEVKPEDWLQEGESITYWSIMPHGNAADIAEAGTVTAVGRRGQVKAEYRVGRAAVATFVLGIVDWTMFDENGNEVPAPRFDISDPGWYSKGKAVMSGLPPAVVEALKELIDGGSPPHLADPADGATSEADTVGNG